MERPLAPSVVLRSSSQNATRIGKSCISIGLLCQTDLRPRPSPHARGRGASAGMASADRLGASFSSLTASARDRYYGVVLDAPKSVFNSHQDDPTVAECVCHPVGGADD